MVVSSSPLRNSMLLFSFPEITTFSVVSACRKKRVTVLEPTPGHTPLSQRITIMDESKQMKTNKSEDDRVKMGYGMEWWMLLVVIVFLVTLLAMKAASLNDLFFSSVAVLSLGLIVLAIIEARMQDRAKFYDREIAREEAERAKAEKETEDKKCESALVNRGRSELQGQCSTILTSIMVSGEKNKPKKDGEHGAKSEARPEEASSDGR